MTVCTFDLRGLPPGWYGTPLRAELALGAGLPLVVMWYRDAKTGEEKGARLDIEKRAFIDHFSSENEEVLLAGTISDLLHASAQEAAPVMTGHNSSVTRSARVSSVRETTS